MADTAARLLERRGLGDDASAEDDTLAMEEPLLASLYAASVTSRIATGSRSGQRVLRMGDRIDADDLPVLQGERCASVGGVSVHANVAVPARDRRRLERRCRYGARPPVASERLSWLAGGRLLHRLKHRRRDGTPHVVFTPKVARAPKPRGVSASTLLNEAGMSKARCSNPVPVTTTVGSRTTPSPSVGTGKTNWHWASSALPHSRTTARTSDTGPGRTLMQSGSTSRAVAAQWRRCARIGVPRQCSELAFADLYVKSDHRDSPL